ncbi:hypothetical protein SZ64_02495 [Erythrobacter sp. SG61-1L]|uniref:hypothetical protein n=1 Tax=Erythrobacter sp. SG61-1L TaxID=1603897 RepID=UPI0006C8EC3E|nr:hypothetical protein [Erythrobacter sp. SG61-1L]KPL67061.1 hypothetical protein SZ64_02495 [Erythrobacter sp. SG61-1L]
MDTVLSILMLASLAMLVGAFVLWRKGGQIKQVALMVLLAFVMIGNVLIWTIPDESGKAPAQKADALAK